VPGEDGNPKVIKRIAVDVFDEHEVLVFRVFAYHMMIRLSAQVNAL
jgi:hypothetical protein